MLNEKPDTNPCALFKYDCKFFSWFKKLIASILVSKPTLENIRDFSEYYSNKLKSIDNTGKIITDKMPGNYRWIGIIKMAFPKSKIVHLTRNPMDTCFSIYKSYFSNETCGYAYNQENIGKYYNLYEKIMLYWHEVFPNEIYNCKYENLVKNTKSEIKNLVDFLELKWEDSLLSFHKNERRVVTVSSTQVRKKTYTSSIKKWENYNINLKKLVKLLKT